MEVRITRQHPGSRRTSVLSAGHGGVAGVQQQQRVVAEVTSRLWVEAGENAKARNIASRVDVTTVTLPLRHASRRVVASEQGYLLNLSL